MFLPIVALSMYVAPFVSLVEVKLRTKELELFGHGGEKQNEDKNEDKDDGEVDS